MRDILSDMQVVHLGTLTLSGTTPAASAWADLSGFDGATLMVVNNTVTDAGTAAGFTLTMQHGDTTAASGAADIAVTDSVDGATVAVTVTSDTADNVIGGALGYVGKKRYIRFNAVGTTLTDASVSIVAILGKPARRKTTAIGTKVAAT